MTDKVLYENVLTSLGAMQTANNSLDENIQLTPNAADMDDELANLVHYMQQIETWAQNNIDQINREQVLNEFLASLKTLMTEYSASFEIGSTSAGYGVSYGEGEASGIKVSVSKDGISSSRVFEGNSLTSDDL